ncbi:MAG: LysE family translocator [Rhizobiales bacterium]|nr:LysE family translocator [Hyphomicrobiales bacterium]
MPDYSTILLFAVAALALTATPGPDMLLIASRSAAQGRIAGLATYAGIAMGTYCHALAAAFGLSQLFLAVPIAYDLVRYAGAVYLLYLAWKAFTSKTSSNMIKSQQKEHSAQMMFKQGLFTNLLNPKMAIFVLALFPQFVEPAAGSVALQIMVFATIINLIGLLVNGVVILMVNRVSGFLAGNNKVRNLSQYILGAVFAGLAVRLAIDNQR